MKTKGKKAFYFVLGLIGAVGMGLAAAQTVQAEEGDFVIKKGVLEEYKGAGGDIQIPEEVTEIGDHAFSGCESMKSVVIPANTKKIGNYAFQECNGLEKVTIPGKVKEIGTSSFEACKKLTSVKMENGVSTIMSSAFSGCKKLTSITIPKSVKKIGGRAFDNTSWLNKKRKARKDHLVIVNHILVDGKKAKGKISIPKGVTAVTDAAFDGAKIKNVKIPATVKTIGDYAFLDTAIEKITFPKSVKSIGSGALCVSKGKLKEITILNPKAKLVHNDMTVFDGSQSGSLGNKIIIRGYKKSTAEKLAKENNRRVKAVKNNQFPIMDFFAYFKKAEFRQIKK